MQPITLGGCQGLKLRRRRGLAEVVRDDGQRLRNARQDFRQPAVVRVDLYMPVQPLETLEQRMPFRAQPVIAAHEIEPHAAHAQGLHALELDHGDVRRDHHHAAQSSGLLRQQPQQVGVVGAQEARLHEHALRDAMGRRGRDPVLQRRRVGRHIARAGHARAGQREGVEMGVDHARAGRGLDVGRGRRHHARILVL